MACTCDCHDDESSCPERCRSCGIECFIHGQARPPHLFVNVFEQYDRPIGPPLPPEPGWFLLCRAHCTVALDNDPDGSWTPALRPSSKVLCDWEGCDKRGVEEWYPTKRGTVAGRSC